MERIKQNSKGVRVMKAINFLICWLKYSFMQNSYLFPKDKNDNLWYPYKKKHIWRTRIGFISAWGVAKAICDMKGINNQ